MKWLFTLLAFFHLAFLNAQFTPPPNPAQPPAGPAGYLPFVIVNNSLLPDSDINVVITGRDVTNTNLQEIAQINTGTGVGTFVPASTFTNTSDANLTLAQFPHDTEGNAYFYLNVVSAGIIFFSVGTALDQPVVAGQIQGANFTSPSQPNYTTNFDTFEFAYVTATTPNISANATAVNFFSIPLYGYISTPSPGSDSNTGLYQPRSYIMSGSANTFSMNALEAAELAQWNSLFLTNGSTTIYRLLSTGKAMTATPTIFDPNYLDNAAAYGYSFLEDIWYGPASFYRTHPLVLTIPAGSLGTYTGTINPDNSITFLSSLYTVGFDPPTTSTPTTTSDIFSGIDLAVIDTSPNGDGVQVSKLFEEAIIAGLVPTAMTLSNPYLLENQDNFYMPNPNISPAGQPPAGPWYDLYSKALHNFGFIYTFAFDEPLWPQVAISSNTLESNTYLGITIGNLVQAVSSVTITSSANPAGLGETVTFTATVTGVSPTGTATFIIDGVEVAVVPLVNGQASFSISTLSVGTHTIVVQYSGDANNLAATSPTFIQTITSILPPINLHVIQVKNRFATQSDLINIITWQAPTSGTTPVLYRIYRDPQLTQLIGTVPASSVCNNMFKFEDHNRKKGRTYTYFIVSVDAFGAVSTPAEVVFQGKKEKKHR
jgi:Beta-1,3-glucanase/Bacterial Ig-like domain (group 3)